MLLYNIEIGYTSVAVWTWPTWTGNQYKTGNRVMKRGLRRSETARQLNWLVFAQREPVAGK